MGRFKIVTIKSLLFAISLGCATCGPKPPTGQPLSVATPAPSATVVAAPRVPEPGSLMMVLRVKEIESTWRSIAELVPFLEHVNEALGSDAKVGAEALLGKELTGAIDFKATFEMGFGEERSMVFSIPLVSFQSAVADAQRAFDVRRINDWAVALEPRTATGKLFEQRSCQAWRIAEGRGKLLCGLDAELPEFAAYLAGKPESHETPAAPLRLELSRSLLKQAIQEGRAETSAETEAERLGHDIASEFLRDLGGVSLGVYPASEPLQVELELEFASSRSIITSAALGRPSAAVAPDDFWRLPKDSLLAISWEGMPPGARRNDVRALLDRVARSVPPESFDPSGQAELAAAMQELVFTGGPLWFAYGVDSVAAHLALQTYLNGDAANLKSLEAARRALSGWAIFATPEPFEKWRDGIKKLVEVDARYAKAHRAPGNQRAPGAGRGAPPAPATPSSSKTLVIRQEVPVPPRLGLPAKAFHLSIESSPNPDYLPPAGADLLPITASEEHLVLIGLGDKSWLCYAPIFTVCAEKLLHVSRGGENALADLPEAVVARATRGSWRGLGSPASVFTLFSSSDTRAELSDILASLSQLNRLPNAGRDLLLLRGETRQNPTSPNATLVLTLSVPRKDLLSWFALAGD